MQGAIIVVVILLSLLLGGLGYNLAEKRGRRPWLWGWLGLGIFFVPILGIVALIVLASLPDLRAHEAEAEIERALPVARIERLTVLGELHEKGGLSDDEFAVEKEWVLHHDQKEWGPSPTELARIAALHDTGTLTDEEYEHEKRRVLAHN